MSRPALNLTSLGDPCRAIREVRTVVTTGRLARTISVGVIMAFVAVPGVTKEALGQDSVPPTVSIDPGTGTFFGPSVPVTIEWCDDQELDGGSRKIELNGQDVTASFSFQ